MQFIPVIDLYNNEVVHAVRGRRDDYRPVKSVLSPNADPLTITESLLRLYPFSSVYIADLNAICGSGNNTSIITKLLSGFSNIQFIIDCGMKELSVADNHVNYCPVAGSESIAELAEIPRHLDQDNFYLSLDFRDGEFLGNPLILESPSAWPQNVIIMSLERVGTSQGTDLERLARIRAIGGDKNYLAAGGVRDVSDLDLLEEAGITGVLLATSLHTGKITGETLRRFAQR